MENLELITKIIESEEVLKEKYSQLLSEDINDEASSHESVMAHMYYKYIKNDPILMGLYLELVKKTGKRDTIEMDEMRAYSFQNIDLERLKSKFTIESLSDIEFRFYYSGRLARVGDVYYRMLLGTSSWRTVPIIVHESELNKLYIIPNIGERKGYESINNMTIVQTTHCDVDDNAPEDDLFYNWDKR